MASRVSCVSIYLCAIYSSSEPVRLLCKSQNSPAESIVCALSSLVGLDSFSTHLIKPSTCNKVTRSLGVAVLAVTLDSTSTFYDGRVQHDCGKGISREEYSSPLRPTHHRQPPSCIRRRKPQVK